VEGNGSGGRLQGFRVDPCAVDINSHPAAKSERSSPLARYLCTCSTLANVPRQTEPRRFACQSSLADHAGTFFDPWLDTWIDSADLLTTVAFLPAGEEVRRQAAGDPADSGQEGSLVSLEPLDARKPEIFVVEAAGENQRIQTSASGGTFRRRSHGRSLSAPTPFADT